MRKITRVSLLFVSVACFFALPVLSYAAGPTTLPVTPVSQHLAVADSNGDTGYYDCAIAAEAMALHALAQEGKISLSADGVSYTPVRLAIRRQYGNIGKGITLREAAATIPSLTNNTLGAAFVKVDSQHWDDALSRQLASGFPVIIHINDWSYLDGHVGQGRTVHAIVVSGLDMQAVYYVDPWDGQMHTMSRTAFAAAWAQGYYNWSALIFIEKKPPTNFSDLLRLLAAKRAA